MAVIYPSSIRGMTAGALRQIKQQGYSVSSTPMFTAAYVNSIFTHRTGHTYFNKREPCGRYMETLEQTKDLISDNTEAIRKSAIRMVETANEANKSMSEVTGKVRGGVDKLSGAIDKFMKTAGRPDFEKSVQLATQLAKALETLAALEDRGLLERVMRSMGANK